MISKRTENSTNWIRGAIGAVTLLAAIATIATFFGLSSPSQVVVLDSEEEKTPPTQPASPDYSDYIARASGVGFAPSAAASDTERRQAALRAAHVVARRNLLAFAEGSDIEAVTVVVDSTIVRDDIRETVQGRLAEAVTISESYDAVTGQAQVVVGIRRSLTD